VLARPSTEHKRKSRLLEDTLVEENIHPRYVSAGQTHTGKLRPTNQDALVTLDDVGMWVVADGMGGYRDGDVASRLVCESLADLQQVGQFEETIESVRQRLSEVNRRLYKAATRVVNPVLSGSTVVALLVRRTTCAVIWAGDSRVYRLRAGRLTQMTTDHTWAAELNLQTSDEEADHAITRAVGGEATLSLDVRLDRVRLGDRFLLCSDGLTHEIGDARIGELLGRGDVEESANALIIATLESGARDNVTVIVVDAT
jgi:serine/threonine protein phosphatase PrpC